MAEWPNGRMAEVCGQTVSTVNLGDIAGILHLFLGFDLND